MIYRRGNKRRIAKHIISLFPAHEHYIEPFFGAGGIFFNKQKAKYNFLNDNDDEVYTFFKVVSNKDLKSDLIDKIQDLIYHQSLFNFYKKTKFEDDINKAIRFLYLSFFSLYAGYETFRSVLITRNEIIKIIENIFDFIKDNCFFYCLDFRKFLEIDNFSRSNKKFIYADPPYLNTERYKTNFKLEDFKDLVNILIDKKTLFAISEFENELVLDYVKSKNLNVIKLLERQNVKNRKTEILITNYKINNSLFYANSYRI